MIEFHQGDEMKIGIVIVMSCFLLWGCMLFLGPNPENLAQQVVADMNGYLSGTISDASFSETYVYLEEPATSTDALFACRNLLDFLTVNASSVGFISVGDSGLKGFDFFIQNPPRFVSKVYIFNAVLESAAGKSACSFPLLLIQGNPYLMTVYSSETALVVYPEIIYDEGR